MKVMKSSFTGTGVDPNGNTLSYLWEFGVGSGIANSTQEDPGLVQFNNPGTYTVVFTVIDSSGLYDSTPDIRLITVNGIPSITAPADVSVEATGQQTSVDIGTATAVDLEDGPLPVSNDAPATFPVGTTVVTWTATDAAGNTVTATQNVTVVDTTVPVVNTSC